MSHRDFGSAAQEPTHEGGMPADDLHTGHLNGAHGKRGEGHRTLHHDTAQYARSREGVPTQDFESTYRQDHPTHVHGMEVHQQGMLNSNGYRESNHVQLEGPWAKAGAPRGKCSVKVGSDHQGRSISLGALRFADCLITGGTGLLLRGKHPPCVKFSLAERGSVH